MQPGPGGGEGGALPAMVTDMAAGAGAAAAAANAITHSSMAVGGLGRHERSWPGCGRHRHRRRRGPHWRAGGRAGRQAGAKQHHLADNCCPNSHLVLCHPPPLGPPSPRTRTRAHSNARQAGRGTGRGGACAGLTRLRLRCNGACGEAAPLGAQHGAQAPMRRRQQLRRQVLSGGRALWAHVCVGMGGCRSGGGGPGGAWGRALAWTAEDTRHSLTMGLGAWPQGVCVCVGGGGRGQ
jgi:hypothetical protein